jgi:histone acetyltransferase (RNA polymerase elongator complex component)
MEEAERIAREEHGSGRIAVISGKLSTPQRVTADV